MVQTDPVQQHDHRIRHFRALLLGGQRREALLGAALRGGRERDDQLTGMRGVVDAHLHGLVVRPEGGVGDVLERDVEDRTGRAPLLDGRQQGGRPGRLAEVVAELQGVDQWQSRALTSPSSPTIAALP